MKYWLILSLLLIGGSPLFAYQFQDTLELQRSPRKFKDGIRLPFHFLRLSLLTEKELSIESHPYGPHKRQYILICKAKEKKVDAGKICFYIHGGAWHIGKPKQNLYLAARLIEEGYTVLLPGYRLGPKFCYEDLQMDIDQAFVKSMEMLKLDQSEPKQVLIGGVSAGANLAALFIFDNERLGRLGYDANFFKGFFSLAGPLDINKMEDSKLLENYAGDRSQSTFQMANPINLVDRSDSISCFLMHGKRDAVVPYQATESFEKTLKQHRIAVECHLLETSTHIEVTNRWYYKEKVDVGQEDYILNWVRKLP